MRDKRWATAIWSSLPLCPWPARWTVADGRADGEFVIALSRSARRTVRVGHEVSGITQDLFLADSDPEAGVEVVGTVTVRDGYGGLAEACRLAAEMGLAHLVIEG